MGKDHEMIKCKKCGSEEVLFWGIPTNDRVPVDVNENRRGGFSFDFELFEELNGNAVHSKVYADCSGCGHSWEERDSIDE